MLAALRQRLLRTSPRVRAWLELLEEGEARIVTRTLPHEGETPVFRSTIDLFGDIAFQVHRGTWNGLTGERRAALATEHRARMETHMNLLVAPERALRRVALAMRLGCFALAGGLSTGVLALVDQMVWIYGLPALVPLLWKPAEWAGRWLVAHELRRLTGELRG